MISIRKNKLEEKVVRLLNNMTLNRKLVLLYIFCVVFPLLLTDGVILTMIISNERSEFNEEMRNVATNVSADFIASVKTAADVSNNLYVDSAIYKFLDTGFTDNADFYSQYFYKCLTKKFSILIFRILACLFNPEFSCF